MKWYHNFLSEVQNVLDFFARFPDTHKESCYECLEGLAVATGEVRDWNFTAAMEGPFPYADLEKANHGMEV